MLVSSGHIGGSDHSSEGSQQAGDEIWVGRPVKIRGLREFREGVGCGVWGVGCGVWGVGCRDKVRGLRELREFEGSEV